MELDTIFRLMDRAESSSFSKVEVQMGDLRLVLERGAMASVPSFAPVPAATPEPAEPKELDAVDDRAHARRGGRV